MNPRISLSHRHDLIVLDHLASFPAYTPRTSSLTLMPVKVRCLANPTHSLLVDPTSDAGKTTLPSGLGRLLRLLVSDEEFAALAIAAWHVAGDFDDIEDAGGVSEDAVHLLQGSVGCLRLAWSVSTSLEKQCLR